MAEPVNSNTTTHSNEEDEVEDTATNELEKLEEVKESALQDLLAVDDLLDYVVGKQKEQVEDEGDKEVVIEDRMVLKDLLRYQEIEGVLPFENSDHMQQFCYPWIRLGYGNKSGWNAYFEKLKNKYKNRVVSIEPGLKEEFKMWRRFLGMKEVVAMMMMMMMMMMMFRVRFHKMSFLFQNKKKKEGKNLDESFILYKFVYRDMMISYLEKSIL